MGHSVTELVGCAPPPHQVGVRGAEPPARALLKVTRGEARRRRGSGRRRGRGRHGGLVGHRFAVGCGSVHVLVDLIQGGVANGPGAVEGLHDHLVALQLHLAEEIRIETHSMV